MIQFHWGRPRQELQLRSARPYSSTVVVGASGEASLREGWDSEAHAISSRWGVTLGDSLFIGIVCYGSSERVNGRAERGR